MGKGVGRIIVITGAIVWTLLLIRTGTQIGQVPQVAVTLAFTYGLLLPGMILGLMMAVAYARREGRARELDRRVVIDTVAQLVAAMAIWPALGTLLGHPGAGLMIVLGPGLAISRLAFWAGMHVSPLLRLYGFAASLMPTLAAGLWILWIAVDLATG